MLSKVYEIDIKVDTKMVESITISKNKKGHMKVDLKELENGAVSLYRASDNGILSTVSKT